MATTILLMFKAKNQDLPKRTLDKERFVLMKHIIDVQRIYYNLEIESLENRDNS